MLMCRAKDVYGSNAFMHELACVGRLGITNFILIKDLYLRDSCL